MTQLKQCFALACLPALALAGCAADEQDDVAEIQSALESQNGGLDMLDEAPAFGDTALDELADSVVLADDSMGEDAEVVAMHDAPEALLYHTAVLWGQFPGSHEVDEARNWSGRLSVNRGAIVVRSRVGFEDGTDRVLPRSDRRVVDFTSVTRPHRDGLRLTIIDPTPESDEPLRLRYRGTDGTVFEGDMRDIANDRVGQDVDERGNRIVVDAIRDPRDVCSFGFLAGRWQKVGERHGRLLGRVSNPRGEAIGHIRGIWGQRRNGNKVFFGKYINREGGFRGIFAGHYEDGQFRGRWLARGGDRGVLGGGYRQNPEIDRVGGHFRGRWAETSCDLGIHTDARSPE